MELQKGRDIEYILCRFKTFSTKTEFLWAPLTQCADAAFGHTKYT